MRRVFLVSAAVFVLVVAGVGASFVAGVGPFATGASADGQSADDFPTQTAAASGGSGGSSTGGDAGTNSSSDGSTDGGTNSESTPPYRFSIKQIEECGQTCRDVTSSVTNRQDEKATGVTVYSRIFVGNSTDPDDVVWRGSEDVGSLSAGESYSTTKRVELSYSEAFAVQQAGGWITVQTTIETDDQTLTYKERRDVT
ncbi:hypothetical protein ACFQJC_01295 [Haloferax namakaokahaiae]|uniref:Uncharacterized protein n=1 Tax=Haloferax namakaokahaiae TaxID=1748331 RepID=A0ABD5ZA11_9EURY